MTSKTFEIRDRMTLMPVLAVRLDPGTERDRYLIALAGYGVIPEQQKEHVILIKIQDWDAQWDSYAWRNQRTTGNAHRYIIEHFDELETGSVVDVEFILGETQQPKTTEV